MKNKIHLENGKETVINPTTSFHIPLSVMDSVFLCALGLFVASLLPHKLSCI